MSDTQNNNVQPCTRGRCEAGLPGNTWRIARLPYCAKRARWVVNGVLLCGGCKKKVVG